MSIGDVAVKGQSSSKRMGSLIINDVVFVMDETSH